jgi:hypothetical protein
MLTMPVLLLEPLRLALQCQQIAWRQGQLLMLAPWLFWAPTEGPADGS